MTMTISRLPDESDQLTGFRFFWLRYVWGFLPHEHCQKSLVGTNDLRFDRHMQIGASFELTPPKRTKHLYLCGVTAKAYPGLHFAFEAAEGETATDVTYNGITITVENARRLPIPTLEDGFKDMPHSYTSCCNWQFGVEYYGLANLRRELVEGPLPAGAARLS